MTGAGYEPTGEVRSTGGSTVGRGEDAALDDLAQAAVLCNSSALLPRDGQWVAVGDPTEVALLTLADKAGVDRGSTARRHPRVDEVPFASETQLMATLHRSPSGSAVVAVKGAVEAVLPRARAVILASLARCACRAAPGRL